MGEGQSAESHRGRRKSEGGEGSAVRSSDGAGITTHNGISEISPLLARSLAHRPSFLLPLHPSAPPFSAPRQTYCSTNEIVHLVSSPLQHCRRMATYSVARSLCVGFDHPIILESG